MAVYVTTANPKGLWDAFAAAIKKNKIETWNFYTDGVHFTHTADQWKNRAFFKPVVAQGLLAFNIVKPKSEAITVDVYAEYHALLIRALLAHFDGHFSSAASTAMPEWGDIVSI